MIQHFISPDNDPILPPDTCLKLKSISTVPSSHLKKHPRAAHCHSESIEIQMALNGTGEFILDCIPYSLKHGDILVLNSNSIHDEIEDKNKDMDLFVISFSGLKLPGLPANCMVKDLSSPLIPSGPHSKLVFHIMRNIYDVFMENLPGSSTVCNHLLYALVCRVLMLLDAQESPALPPAHYDIEKSVLSIKKYIDTHYMENITLESIGRAVNLSPYYLSHIFKKLTDFSPIQYLTRRRLGEAQTLLIHTDKSITQISMEIGYETVSNFNNSFSKYIGLSPSRYRKVYRNTKNPIKELGENE